MDSQKMSILVLDDEPDIRREINEFLSARKFKVFEASAPSEAFRILKARHIDISILDIQLPEMDGLEVLRKIRTKQDLN